MRVLYRMMLPDDDGSPAVGRSGRKLGVRIPPDPWPDIRPDDAGLVHPDSGGMSVSPDSIDNLPRLRVPRSFGSGATGKDTDVIFATDESAFVPSLRVQPDAARPSQHAHVEPAAAQRVEEYEDALAASRPRWRREWPR